MKDFTLVLWAVLISILGPGAAWAQPTWQWATGATGSGTSGINAISRDGAGNSIVVGDFEGTITLGSFTLTSAGGSDILVGRLSPSGTWLQVVQAGSTNDEMSYALTTDAAGNIVVLGGFRGTTRIGSTTLASSSTFPTLFVARLSAASSWAQVVKLDLIGNANSVAVDGADNIVVGGSFRGTITDGTHILSSANGGLSIDAFVAWLSPAANAFNRVTTVGGMYSEGIISLAADGNGAVTVVGFFEGNTQFGPISLTSAGNLDAFVARLSPTGTWTQAVRAGGPGNDRANALALDAAGNATITGVFSGTASFGSHILGSAGGDDVFVARLNPAGTWAQAVRAGGTGNETANALVIDAAGNATVAGEFAGSASFGTTTVSSTNFATDVFVAQVEPAGTWAQATHMGGIGHDYAKTVTIDNAGNTTVAGIFSGFMFVGPTVLNSTSGVSAYVARFGSLVSATTVPHPAEVFTLAPNPATSQVSLRWPAATTTSGFILLFDGLGREVRRQQLPAHAMVATLDLAGLTAGLYVLRCGAATAKLVVE